MPEITAHPNLTSPPFSPRARYKYLEELVNVIDGVVTERGSYSDELVVLILREAQIRKKLQLSGCGVRKYKHFAPSIEHEKYAVAMTDARVPTHSALFGGHVQHAVEIFDGETEGGVNKKQGHDSTAQNSMNIS